jgi:protein TonB
MAMAMFHSEGVYRVGGGVSVPRLLVNNPHEYTAEAHGARIEGQVELVVTIGEDGIARDMRIQKSLGYGLDEKAIDCVSNWLP